MLKHSINLPAAHPLACPERKRMLLLALLLAATCLAACGSRNNTGQVLARVNGEDITELMLNNELKRSGIQADLLEEEHKQLLESMIDRQLLVAEAMRRKIDRIPEIMQSIEHARLHIIEQAYLEKISSDISRPPKIAIEGYYQDHPELFSRRKEFALNQLVFPGKNFSPALKSFIDTCNSIDKVANWLDTHHVPFTRKHILRSTTDLPQKAVTILQEMPKGKFFLITEGGNKILNLVTAINDRPVSLPEAELQIEQFLSRQIYKNTVNSEIARLRALSKIMYPQAAATQAASVTPVSNTVNGK